MAHDFLQNLILIKLNEKYKVGSKLWAQPIFFLEPSLVVKF